jgi:hypothetical protein
MSFNTTGGASINPVNPIPVPAGLGGDSGVGFHGSKTETTAVQGSNLTEQKQFKSKHEEANAQPSEAVASHQTFLESPFTRYVRRPLSDGGEPKQVYKHKPEDRSKMGVPLNPFWIRNDYYSIEKEADIFLQPEDFVAPVIHHKGEQSEQTSTKRKAHLENEVQPQMGGDTTKLAKDNTLAPKETIAGSVSSNVEEAGKQVIPDTKPNDIGENNPADGADNEPESKKQKV